MLFLTWGWLLIAVLPLTQLGGRALFNVLASVYGLWGLLSLWGYTQRLDVSTTLLYLAMLVIFFVGIPIAVDPTEGLKVWAGFLAPSLAMLMVQVALWEPANTPDRLLNSIALFGSLTLAGLSITLCYYGFELSGQPFDPRNQLREDELPFLLPFLLSWFWWRYVGSRRYWGMVGAAAAVLAYIVISGGRAAFFGAVIALLIFGKILLGWRLRWLSVLGIGVLAIIIVTDPGLFRRSDLDPQHPLNAFTSGRSALWRQALEHPPERPWLGVGLGNGRYATETLSFELGGVQKRVQHLHNFVLDAWYETGILGVGSLLALIAVVFWRLARQWAYLGRRDQERAGVLLAAALAILGTAMLSFSYTSRHFSYLFACLGGLIYLSDFSRGGLSTKKAWHRRFTSLGDGGTDQDKH